MSANDAPRTHREIFFDSDRRVGKGIATFGGFEQATFEGLETIDDVSADPDAMDILVDDGRVYVEITRSVVAMESQAAHQVAMDRVAASQTAMDTVAASQTAMDTVAASTTAMAAVGSSVLAVTAALAGTASDFLWSSASADSMRAFLENAGGLDTPGDADLPHTVSGTDGFVYDADEMGGLYGLDAQVHYDDEPSNLSTDRTWAIRFDASNFDDIKLEHEAVGDFRRDAVIEIDGSEVFSTGSDSSLQERSFDISGISGEVDIAIGVENDWFENDDLTEVFATRLRLE